MTVLLEYRVLWPVSLCQNMSGLAAIKNWCKLTHTFDECPITLENNCTRIVQSSHVGCSRRLHTIGHLAVKKGTILIIILLQKILIANFWHA